MQSGHYYHAHVQLSVGGSIQGILTIYCHLESKQAAVKLTKKLIFYTSFLKWLPNRSLSSRGQCRIWIYVCKAV